MGCLKLTYYESDSFQKVAPSDLKISVKGCAGDYRYGFNSMEKDDEVKGRGNSYDFGARMYDSRLGRWLTIDALSAKKPDLSPYQSFRNNPIVFIDPDGNDEWNSVILKDQQGNIVTKSITRVSTLNIMSSGIEEISDGGGGFYRRSNGYDFKNEITFQIQGDGSIKYMGTEQILLKHNGIKDREYGAFAKTGGTVYNTGLSGGYEMPGGMYLYSKGGEGTKYYSRKDVQGMEADWLTGLLGALGKSNFKSLPKNSDAFKDLTNNLKQMAEELGILPNGDKDYGVQSNKKKDEQSKVIVVQPIIYNSHESKQYGPESRKDADNYTGGTYNKTKDTLTIPKDDRRN